MTRIFIFFLFLFFVKNCESQSNIGLSNALFSTKSQKTTETGDPFAKEFKLIKKSTTKDPFLKKVTQKSISVTDAFTKKQKSTHYSGVEKSPFSVKHKPKLFFEKKDAFLSSKPTSHTGGILGDPFANKVKVKQKGEFGDHFSSSPRISFGVIEKDAFSNTVPRLKSYFDSPDAFSSKTKINALSEEEKDAFAGGGKGKKRNRFIGETGKLSLKTLFNPDSKKKQEKGTDAFTLSPRKERKRKENNYRKQGENDLFQKGVLPK